MKRTFVVTAIVFIASAACVAQSVSSPPKSDLVAKPGASTQPTELIGPPQEVYQKTLDGGAKFSVVRSDDIIAAKFSLNQPHPISDYHVYTYTFTVVPSENNAPRVLLKITHSEAEETMGLLRVYDANEIDGLIIVIFRNGPSTVATAVSLNDKPEAVVAATTEVAHDLGALPVVTVGGTVLNRDENGSVMIEVKKDTSSGHTATYFRLVKEKARSSWEGIPKPTTAETGEADKKKSKE